MRCQAGTQISARIQLRARLHGPLLATAIAGALGITSLKLDPTPWLQAGQITVPDTWAKNAQDIRWLGVLALMPQQPSVHAVAAEEKK